jgi:heme exporter protein C
MAIINAFEDPVRGFRAAAVLALVGFINVPIIHFSVEWWSTLHQPSSLLRMDGPAIHPSMLWPLLAMALGFKFYYVTLLLLRVKSELLDARLRARTYAAVDTA